MIYGAIVCTNPSCSQYLRDGNVSVGESHWLVVPAEDGKGAEVCCVECKQPLHHVRGVG